jgi:hypothetical protein
MSTIDYNVDNYTISELFAILGLEFDFDVATDEITQDNINEINSSLIAASNRYKSQFSTQPQLSLFFSNIQTKVLQYTNTLETELNNEQPNEDVPESSEQTDAWFSNQYLTQDDTVQKDKITDRRQKVNLYDNMHFPMKQEQLGLNNNFDVPVSQDVLNPNLKNVINRFITLDSRNRGESYSATDYTTDLSEHVTNVLSLRLYAVSIPYTWYVIDYQFGNTCFWVTNLGNHFKISIEPGNYLPTTFCDAINASFIVAGFTNDTNPDPPIATYSSSSGKIKLALTGWLDPNGEPIITINNAALFDASLNPYIQFYDYNGVFNCFEDQGCNSSASIETTLGWLMGYRLPIISLLTGGNTATVPIDLLGPKYFTIVLDDYNQNNINTRPITNVITSNSIPLPEYFNTSQPYVCIPPNSPLSVTALGNLTNVSEVASADFNFATMQVLPSAPRTLTNAQMYTINEIIKNKNKSSSNRSKAPTPAKSDTFATVYIKYPLTNAGILVEFSGQLQDNKRIYFGPVDIDRLRIRLVDDRGYIVNLNGAQWSCSIICETLYQY